MNGFFNGTGAIRCLLIMMLVSLAAAGAAHARPMTENTRTCEVRLGYSVIRSTESAAATVGEPARADDAGTAFGIIRHQTRVRGVITDGERALAYGSFGARLYDIGRSGEAGAPAPSLSAFGPALERLAKENFFGAVINAAETADGKLYLGTAGGDLIEADGEKARMISIIRSKGRFSINALVRHGGALYIATDGGGLYIYCGNRIFCVSQASHGILSDCVRSAGFASRGGEEYIALGTDRGFSLLRINSPLTNDLEKLYDHRTRSPIETICATGNDILFGGVFGVIRLDLTAETFAGGTSRPVRDLYVTAMAAAGGRIVAATLASGIHELDPGTGGFERTVSAAALEDAARAEKPHVRCIMPAGRRLVLAHEKGLAVLDGNRAAAFGAGDDAVSDRVSAIMSAGDRVFIGTFNSGAYHADAAGGNLRDAPAPLGAARQVNAMAAFAGRIFVGSASGLEAFDGASLRGAELPEAAARARINCLHSTPDALYAGTSDGLLAIGPGLAVTATKLPADRIDRHVYCVYRSPESGDLYFGTFRGFGVISPSSGRLEVFNMMNSAIPDNWVTAIYPVAGSLFVGTYDKGAAIFDPRAKKFSPLPGRNLLPSKMINAGAVRAVGTKLFVGTYNGGLAVIETGGGLEKWTARHFNQRSGLAGDMVTGFAECGGTLFISTFSGLSTIGTDRVGAFFEK